MSPLPPPNSQQLICHPTLLCYSITAVLVFFRTLHESSGFRCILATEFILSGVREYNSKTVVLQPGHRKCVERLLHEGGRGLFAVFSLLLILIFIFRK